MCDYMTIKQMEDQEEKKKLSYDKNLSEYHPQQSNITKEKLDQMASLGNENGEILRVKPGQIYDPEVTAIKGITEEERDEVEKARKAEQDASWKSRTRRKKQRMDTEDKVRTGVKQRNDQIYHSAYNQIAGAMTEEDKQVYKPPMFTDSLDEMRIALSCSHKGSISERKTFMQRIDALEEVSSKIQTRYTVFRFAQERLTEGMEESFHTYIKNEAEQLEQQKKKLEEMFNRYKEEYTQNFGPYLAKQTMRERFQKRVDKYLKKHSGKTLLDAKKEISRRNYEPITVRGIMQRVNAYKQLKKPRQEKQYYRERIGKERLYEVPYKEQMETCLSKVTEKLEKEFRTVKLTPKKAEMLANRLIKELLEKNHYCFRCSAKTFGLIAEDKMKSQMETNSSSAILAVSSRKHLSHAKFGVEDGSIDDSEYENYGYLASDCEETKNITNISQYGDLEVRLSKKRMEGRVTYTVGDSLDKQDYSQPCPVDTPDFAAASMEGKIALVEQAYRMYEKKQTDSEGLNLEKFIAGAGVSYIELQMHGDVDVRDIERITYCIKAPIIPGEKLSDKDKEEWIKKCNEDIQQLECKCKEINENPLKYGRDANSKLELFVVNTSGGSIEINPSV